jgi:hypothetical protein
MRHHFRGSDTVTVTIIARDPPGSTSISDSNALARIAAVGTVITIA